MSHLGKGDLNHRAWSNTISWHVCNLHMGVVVGILQLKLEVDSKNEKEVVK
jgi:hypothetical protein